MTFRKCSLRRPGQLAVATLLTVTLAVLAACSGGDPEQPVTLPGLEEALKVTSSFQREILADHVVTPDENERAVLGTIACMRARSVVVEGPRTAPGKRLDYFWRTQSDTESAAAAAAFDACYREHQNMVDVAWAYQTAPTEAERVRAAEAMEQCLRDAGLDLPGQPASSDYLEAARTDSASFEACRSEVITEFDLIEGWSP